MTNVTLFKYNIQETILDCNYLTLIEDLIATSLGEYNYNPVAEYFEAKPHEEWSDEGCVSWANIEEVSVEEDIATDNFDRDDELQAMSSENSAKKKHNRDGDALYHSTSKRRAIDPEHDAEEALSLILPLIKFSSDALTLKSTTSAVRKPPKEVRLLEGFFEKKVLDINSTIEDSQDSILGDISDLKSVWNSILEEISDSNPSDTINTYIKVNPILSKLKSKALKDRYWKQSFKALELETVSMIGILILKQRETLKNIIAQVSGEEMNINRRTIRWHELNKMLLLSSRMTIQRYCYRH
ncbi:6079_t:CDS:2 [Gigaspora margarita]|uniref:6079_t:CDS:1 n=1 Tax=Gigaspora margarita TaxID=4874 RepID=A0ABM8VXH9_GIGMA|nr:6079_t:CDS:2 [Gigaspora margarita]